jgi:hypothetical protein
VTPEEIPQPLVDILDRHAGKVHSRQGPVLAALAEILTVYEALPCDCFSSGQYHRYSCIDQPSPLSRSTSSSGGKAPPSGDGPTHTYGTLAQPDHEHGTV